MHHPHYDESLFITCSQLVVLIVPLDDLNLARVTLKVLVHTKIPASLAFACVQLKDLQETLVTSTRDVTFLLVPSDHIQVRAVRHANLLR